MAERRREFPALQRRRRFLEQELYSYDKYMRSDSIEANMQTRMALDAELSGEELDELSYILQFMERLENGFHLSRTQWILLFCVVGLSLILALVAVLT